MNWNEKLNLEGEEVIAINIKGILYENETLDEGLKRLGGCRGDESFWLWTANKIFFCGMYDNAKWIESLPRNPSNGYPSHIGGG